MSKGISESRQNKRKLKLERVELCAYLIKNLQDVSIILPN